MSISPPCVMIVDPADEIMGQMDDGRVVVQFLKALPHFTSASTSNGRRLEMALSYNGIKMSVRDQGKSFEANAFLQKELFRTHTFSPGSPDVLFALDAASILDSLSLFGPGGGAHTALRFSHRTGSDKLQMWLEDSGVVVEIIARTKNADDAGEFEFDKTAVSAKVIMLAEYLKEVLNELDMSSESIGLNITGSDQILSLSTHGVAGDCTIDIPGHSELVSSFTTTRDVAASYRTAFFKQALRPLAIAEKISFRVDANYTLCLQYVVKVGGDDKAFLEFFCLAEN